MSREEFAALQQNLKKAKNMLNNVQNENAKFEDDIRNLQETIDKMEAEKSASEMQQETFKKENQSLTSHLQSLMERSSDLESMVRLFTNAMHVHDFILQCESLKREAVAAQQEANGLRLEKQTRSVQESSIDTMAKLQLQKKLRDLQGEVDRLQGDLSSKQELVMSLELENEQLRGSMEQAKHVQPESKAEFQLSVNMPKSSPTPTPALPKLTARLPFGTINQGTQMVKPAVKAIASAKLAPSLDCPTPTTSVNQKWNTKLAIDEDQTESNPNECTSQ